MADKQKLESSEWMANLKIIWMNCNACKAVVQANSTGICLGCQMGFTGIPQEDAYPVQKAEVKEEVNADENIYETDIPNVQDNCQKNTEEELNTDADEVKSPTKIPLGNKAKTRKRVRRKNTKRKKATKKSKKKEVSDGVQGV